MRIWRPNGESHIGRVYVKYEQQSRTRRSLYGTKGRPTRGNQFRNSVRGRSTTTQNVQREKHMKSRNKTRTINQGKRKKKPMHQMWIRINKREFS